MSGNKSVLVERILVSMAAAAAAEVIPEPSPSPADQLQRPHVEKGKVQGVPSESGVFSERWAATAAAAAIEGAPWESLEPYGVRQQVPDDTNNRSQRSRKQGRMECHAALIKMVLELLDNHTSTGGGEFMSSRDVGRGLATMQSPVGSASALIYLKSRWSSLLAFLRASKSIFAVTEPISGVKVFYVARAEAERD